MSINNKPIHFTKTFSIIRGMCGTPIIQQQSTVHKDVTQRLIRKQRSAPKWMLSVRFILAIP